MCTICVVAVLLLAGCSLESSVPGTWSSSSGTAYEFYADGTYQETGRTGVVTVKGYWWVDESGNGIRTAPRRDYPYAGLWVNEGGDLVFFRANGKEMIRLQKD